LPIRLFDRDKIYQDAKPPTIFPLTDLDWCRHFPRSAKAAEVGDTHVQKLGGLFSPDYPLAVQL
jgi:hypothetical protein